MGSLAWGAGLQQLGQGLGQFAQVRMQQDNQEQQRRQQNNELGLRQMQLDRQAMLDALQQERVQDAQNFSQASTMASQFGGQPVGGDPAVHDMLNRNPYAKMFTTQVDPMANTGALGMIPSQREGAAQEQLTWRQPESEKMRIAQGNWASRLGVANTQAQSRAEVARINAQAAYDRLGITDATARARIDAMTNLGVQRIAQARDEAEMRMAEDEFATQVRYIVGTLSAQKPNPLAGILGALGQQNGVNVPTQPQPQMNVPPMPPPPQFGGGRGRGAVDPKNPAGLTRPGGR